MVGYTLLEYIESDGNQYIDTGVGIGCDVHADIQFIQTAKRNLMGFSTKGCRYFGVTTNGYLEIGTQAEAISSYSGLERRIVKVSFDEMGISLTVEDETISKTTTVAYEGSLMLLGGSSKSGLTSYPCSARLYACKVYVDGSLIRDYVPCMDNNGVCGLWDSVNGTFTSSATGINFTGKVKWKLGDELSVSMSEYRHRLFNLLPKRILPQGYFLCEYIESDGTNFIDVGFKPNQDTKIVADMLIVANNSDLAANELFGARTSTKSKAFALQYNVNTSKLQLFYGNGYTEQSEPLPNERTVYELDKGVLSYNGKTISRDYTAFQCLYNLYLFALNNAGSVSYQSISRLYSCQIYDNGTKVRDYIPCVNPEGYFGLYDRVTNEFYNLRTSSSVLTIGRGKVILPENYIWCESIHSDGNAWIDTGFAPNQDTRVICDFSFNTEGQVAIFGGRTSYQSTDFSFWRNTGSVFLSNYNDSSTASASTSTGRFVVDKNKNVTCINETEYSLSYGAFQSPYNMYMFNVNSNNIADTRVGKISMYYCSIFDNGLMIRLFVPCQRDGVFGLYDMVGELFYTSLGSSQFSGDIQASINSGVYIEDTDGNLWEIDSWDNSAVFNSVAVIGENHSFGIAKDHISVCNFSPQEHAGFGYMRGYSYGRTSYEPSEAFNDMDGKGNTELILNNLGTSGSYAAQKCNSYTFANGEQGYLMSAGEYKMIMDNISVVNNALSKVGGTVIDSNPNTASKVGIWTSTYRGSCSDYNVNAYGENSKMGISGGSYALGYQYFYRRVNFPSDGYSYLFEGYSFEFSSRFVKSSYYSEYADSGVWNADINIQSYIGCRPICSLKKQNGGGEQITMITFSIQGDSYQAEQGMTWYEWCNSSYNTGYFSCFGLNYNVTSSSGLYYVYDGSFAYGRDAIENGRDYELWSYD